MELSDFVKISALYKGLRMTMRPSELANFPEKARTPILARIRLHDGKLSNLAGTAATGQEHFWINKFGPGHIAKDPRKHHKTSIILNPERREHIAHEAFHARNPKLGKSEFLARFYGGFRSSRGGLASKVLKGLHSFGHTPIW